MSVNSLNQLLRFHNLSQSAISRDLAISRNVVYKTVHGIGSGSRRVRVYISRKLGFPPSKLFTHLSSDVADMDDFIFYRSFLDK